jgi:AcrR family transcriptional regulator
MATAQPTSNRTGLRERKKQETRDALSWAALRLAVERGLNEVLVEDIAAAAGVSARTFNNYFSSKAEAITYRHLDRALRAAVELAARPASEPLWDAIAAAALSVAGDDSNTPDADWQAGVRLMLREPALQGEYLKVAAAADREVAAAVAARTGTDPVRDMYPHLVAASVSSALQVATWQWLSADPPVAMTTLLRDAFRQIANGLPDPSATGH